MALGRKAAGPCKGERGPTKKSRPDQEGGGTQAGKVNSIKTYFEAKAGGKASTMRSHRIKDRSGRPKEEPPLEKEPDPGIKVKNQLES